MAPRRMDGFARPAAGQPGRPAAARPMPAPAVRPVQPAYRPMPPQPAPRPMQPAQRQAPQYAQRPQQPAARPAGRPMSRPDYYRPQQAAPMGQEQPAASPTARAAASARAAHLKSKHSHVSSKLGRKINDWKVAIQFAIGLMVIAAVAATIVWLYLQYYSQ